MEKIIKVFLGLLIAGATLGGCYSELKDLEFGRIEWSPELAIPLVNSSFTIPDLIQRADTTIAYTEEDGIMVLSLEDDSLFSSSASAFYSLNDQNLPTLPILLTPAEIAEFNGSGQVTIIREAELPYQSDLDSLIIASGEISLALEENFPADGDFSLTVQAGNTPLLNYNYNWIYDGFNAITTDSDRNAFEQVKFIMTGSFPTNFLTLNYSLTLSKSGNINLTSTQNTIDLDISLTDAVFEALYGDLSQKDISTGRNVINTNLLSGVDDIGELKYFFEDPRLIIDYKNSLGLPVLFDISSLIAFKDGDASNNNLDNEILLEAGKINEPSTRSVVFNEQFKSILNRQPDSLALEIDGLIDPNNTTNNFVTAESAIQIGYRLELPLNLSLSGVNFEENYEVNTSIPENIKYAILAVSTINELPIDVTLKAVALDSDSTVLKTLFDGLILPGGLLNEEAEQLSLINLVDNPETDENELDYLNRLVSISLVATLETTNGGQIVEISSLSALSLAISLQTQYTINLDQIDD